MSVALVTNYLPGYRLPLYELLADRLAVEVFCFGGEGHYVAESARDLDRQLEQARFPAHRLERQRDALSLARDHDAVVASTAGRVALPAAYTGARRARRPFLLWASLWRHPRTSAHLASLPLMRSIYRHADAIVTYGPHVSAYVAGLRGSDESVFIAPQAVEPALFGRAVGEDEKRALRAELGLGSGPLALYVGRLVEDKGVRVLAEAWKQMRDAGEAKLCLVGEGPLAVDPDLAAAPGVVVPGHVERSRLAVAYAAADVVVVPSIVTRRFLEPWGLVCNEAMLQARPVIASDAVGAAAGGLVRDGETGLVTKAGDADALTGALERLLADAGLRERLGSRARELVREYSYESAAEGFSRALEAAGVRAPA